MADTPRTQEEILALFADNTSGNISAQDLRDFVVSTWRQPPQFVDMPFFAETRTYQNDNTFQPLDLSGAGPSEFVDDSGLRGSGTYVSPWYSQTWPADSWFSLPRGVWQYNMHVTFSQTLTQTAVYTAVYMDTLDVPSNTGIGFVTFGAWSLSVGSIFANGTITALEDGLVVGAVVSIDTPQPTDVTTIHSGISIVKVA